MTRRIVAIFFLVMAVALTSFRCVSDDGDSSYNLPNSNIICTPGQLDNVVSSLEDLEISVVLTQLDGTPIVNAEVGIAFQQNVVAATNLADDSTLDVEEGISLLTDSSGEVALEIDCVEEGFACGVGFEALINGQSRSCVVQFELES